jgi:urease accessory protein
MKRILSFVALLGAASVASAHPGHGTFSLSAGLSHPLGLDHLLAMVAVGVWSSMALPGAQRWQGPAAFLAAMSLGGVLGAAGLVLPLTEAGIALSVALFGAMLLAGTRLPQRAGLLLIAAAAALHGLAHGAELPAGAHFAAYALGFLGSTAVLHVAGLSLGRGVQQLRRGVQPAVWRGLGLTLGAAGLLMLARI